ncbi:hypothetical protein [Flavobacterium praedii]|uniref:hypothetical protein n=1 Tax=Flavobacterium praedii TaxID=3002900 RepID=UPI002481992C|nr:hypothetical protein [Flavobacterium praedii]
MEFKYKFKETHKAPKNCFAKFKNDEGGFHYEKVYRFAVFESVDAIGKEDYPNLVPITMAEYSDGFLSWDGIQEIKNFVGLVFDYNPKKTLKMSSINSFIINP